MCIFPKIPEPKAAPPPPSPVAANVEAANEARRRAAAGSQSGRASTMLTSLSDAEIAAPAQKKTLLGQ